MISGCMYHKLESLLAPLASTDVNIASEEKICIQGKENHDFTSLEHISARAIMEDEETALRVLPIIPPKFFIPLFKAGIINFYYKNNWSLLQKRTIPRSIIQLILDWPYSSFVLRDVLPSVPPLNLNPLVELDEEEEHYFYEEISYMLQDMSVYDWMLNPSDLDKLSNSVLKTIDISGVILILESEWDKKSSEFLSPRHLVKNVEAAYKENDHSGYDTLEIICDAVINVIDKENVKAFEDIVDLSSRRGARLTVSFKKVIFKMLHVLNIEQIALLFEKLYKNGTKYLEVVDEAKNMTIYEFHNLVIEALDCLSLQLQGLSLAYPVGIDKTSLTFLNKMINLKQLNLTGMRLRNKLGPLRCLPRGLLFLKLENCDLTGYDLKFLKRSHHKNTLLQLNISNNDFGSLFDASELISLCQDLVVVEILEIEKCFLWDHLCLFLESLAILQNLCLLSLCFNGFSSSSLLVHSKLFNNFHFLKCVKLSVPIDLENGINDFKCKIENAINYNRKTYIQVVWNNEF